MKELELNAKQQKIDEAGSARASAPLNDAMASASAPLLDVVASASHESPIPGTPSTPYFPTVPSTAAVSPAPTVASEVHIPDLTSRYDSSAHNSDYEMDVDTLSHAEVDRGALQEP